MKKKSKQLHMKGMPPPSLTSFTLFSKTNDPATDKQIDTIIKLRRVLRMYNNKDLETISKAQASEQIRILTEMIKQERK